MAQTKKTGTELATVGSFALVTNPYQDMDPEDLEELKDQMEDLDEDTGITCRLVKIPSGGKLAYEVQGEDDADVEYMKAIEGVIIFTHRLNGYWPGAYGTTDNKIPVCSSMDGKTGIWNGGAESGEVRTCENCPYNQYNTAVDQAGNQAKGKACKNMRRIYFMMDGDPNFYLLTVPPTSLKEANKQLKKILSGGTPYTGLIVTFKLEKAKNANGIEYSKVVIEKTGLLPPAIANMAKAMRRQIKEKYQSLNITLDDYAPAQEQGRGKGGGVDVPPMSDEEWAALTGEAPADATFQEAGDLPFEG